MHNQNIESFLVYFVRILSSCVVYQDSILQTAVCVIVSSVTLFVLPCSYSTRDKRSLILEL